MLSKLLAKAGSLSSPSIIRLDHTLKILGLLGVSALLTGCSRLPEQKHFQKPSSVILISIDTLRADHLGCYGYFRSTSPYLDQFARDDAILFEEVLSPGGGTLPAHVSMFTSIPPLAHDVFPTSGKTLNPAWITLAETLHGAGYTTAGFTGGGFVVSELGLDHGFEFFDDEGSEFSSIMPKVEGWLDNNSSEEFFLFLHTYDVHSAKIDLPYHSPDAFDDTFVGDYSGDFTGCIEEVCASKLLRSLNHRASAGGRVVDDVLTESDLDYVVALYDGGIAYIDLELGRFFARLKQRGLYDQSLIIVTSDHGEEFLEHGRFLHHQPYEEIARIPLLVKLPGQELGGLRVPGLTSTLDIMPTILEIIGSDAESQMSGISLVAAIQGTPTTREGLIVFGGRAKLRTDEWSFVVRNNEPYQLFRLSADPSERKNVLDEHPDVSRQLMRQFRQRRSTQLEMKSDLQTEDLSGAADLSTAAIEQLEALGYLH